MTRILAWCALLASAAFISGAHATTPRPPGLYSLSGYWHVLAPVSVSTLAVQVVPSGGGIPVTFNVQAGGASLTLPNGASAMTVTTDQDGFASVDAVANTAPGLVNVGISAPGFQPIEVSYVVTAPVALVADKVRHRRLGENLLDARVQLPWFPCAETLEPYFFTGNASLTLNGMPIPATVTHLDCDYANGTRIEGSAHANIYARGHLLPGTYDYDLLFGTGYGIPPVEAKGTVVIEPDVTLQTATGPLAFSFDRTPGGYYHAGRCASVSAAAGRPGDAGFPASGPPGVDLVNGLVKVDGTQCSWEDGNSFGAPTAPDELVLRQNALLRPGDQPLPPGTQAWVYGPSAEDAAPHWYALPTALSGASAMFQMVDGADGDNATARNREIHGIVALGVPHAGAFAGSLQDLWWGGPQENGWGMSLTQHGERLFAGLFIYDANGDPTWLVMSGGSWNGARTEYSGSLYRPRGSFFAAYDASRFAVGPPVGTLKLTVASIDALTLDYTIDGVSGRKSVKRQLFGPAVPFYAPPMSDLWWGGLAQNGWGLAVAQQFATGFGVLFTYDASGNPIWFVLPAVEVAPEQPLVSPIYRTRGSPWVGVPYDASRLTVSQAGGALIGFTGAAGFIDLTIDASHVHQALTVQPF